MWLIGPVVGKGNVIGGKRAVAHRVGGAVNADDGRADGGRQVQGAGIAADEKPRAPCQGDELHERGGQVARALGSGALQDFPDHRLFRGGAGQKDLLAPGACQLPDERGVILRRPAFRAPAAARD